MIDTQSKFLSLAFFTCIAVAIFMGGYHVSMASTEPTDEGEATYPFSLTKKFSDVYPQGYTADLFTFQIEGTSDSGTSIDQTVALDRFTDDTADATVQLPIGTYTITEIGPDSFVPGEWTVQWSGFGCENANSPALFTTMTVSDDSTANVCRADNQWRHGKLTVEKIVVGTSTSPENFDFTVAQGSNVRYDGPFDADGINSDIVVAIGEYSVIETSNSAYTTSYSEGCTGVMEQGSNASCTITNTYTENADGGGDGGGSGSYTNGMLVVKKVIVGTSTVPVTDFSFNYTGASGSTTFDSSGTNQFSVASGTYTVTETPTLGYTTSYENCSAVTVVANATTTCIITNTVDTTTGGGGDTDDEGDKYRLQGYVWHDVNEDGVWDETEDPLQNWTVHLTGSSSSESTVTDDNGYYFFLVDEGTWTLSETVQADWEQTFPQPITHEVTVPEAEAEQVTVRFPFNYFFSIAHAETITISEDFNFGNVFKGGSSSSGGSGGGGGGSATRTDRNNDGGGTNDAPDPTPVVLGEQVSPVPTGAANAGAGGTATAHPSMVLYLFTLIVVAGAIGLVTKQTMSK